MSTEVIIIEKQEEEEKPIEFLEYLARKNWTKSLTEPRHYDKIECIPYKNGLHLFIAQSGGWYSIFKGKLNSGKVE